MAAFGTAAKAKLVNVAATGEPEEQLRSPFEALLLDMTELGGLPRKVMTCVGESALRDLKTCPDFARHQDESARGVHRVEGTRQGSRSSEVQESARQAAVGETSITAELDLHRRERVQPVP